MTTRRHKKPVNLRLSPEALAAQKRIARLKFWTKTTATEQALIKFNKEILGEKTGLSRELE